MSEINETVDTDETLNLLEQAKVIRYFYSGLIMAGFKPDEALEITKAWVQA